MRRVVEHFTSVINTLQQRVVTIAEIDDILEPMDWEVKPVTTLDWTQEVTKDIDSGRWAREEREQSEIPTGPPVGEASASGTQHLGNGRKDKGEEGAGPPPPPPDSPAASEENFFLDTTEGDLGRHSGGAPPPPPPPSSDGGDSY